MGVSQWFNSWFTMENCWKGWFRGPISGKKPPFWTSAPHPTTEEKPRDVTIENKTAISNSKIWFPNPAYPEQSDGRSTRGWIVLSKVQQSEQYLSGWWFQPLWKILVNWDDEIPSIWKNKFHVPNHQPGIVTSYQMNPNDSNGRRCVDKKSLKHLGF